MEKKIDTSDGSIEEMIKEKLTDAAFLERLIGLAMGRSRAKTKESEDHENVTDAEFEAWAKASKQKIDENPENPDHWFHYGVALASLGRNIDAENSLARTVNLAPRHTKAWYWLGTVRNVLGYDDEALEAYEKATEYAPDWAQAWCDKGVSLAKLGKYEDSTEAFNVSLRLNDKDAFTWCNKGCMLRDMELYEEALKALTIATELDEKAADVWDFRGDVLRTLGRIDEASFCFEKTVQINPEHALGWLDLGQIYSMQGKYNECVEALDKAIGLSYPDVKPYVLKILALIELGRIDEATELCNEGIEKWDDLQLYQLKSGLLWMSKKYEECVDFVDEAIDRGIDVDQLEMIKAGALVELERYQECLNALKPILSRCPGNLDALACRAYCLCKIGQPNEALQEIEEAIENDQDYARSWYAKANICAAIDDLEHFLLCLKKAIELDPQLAQEAMNEKEFARYKDLKEFKKIVCEQ